MIGPVSGDTACGEAGDGRMCEPSDIAHAAMALVEDQRTNKLIGSGLNKKGE